MKMNAKKTLCWFGILAGILLVVGGLILSKKGGLTQGFGYAMPGMGIALAIICIRDLYIARRKPELLHQQEIEEKDERNQLVRGKAAYITFVISLYVLGMLGSALWVSGLLGPDPIAMNGFILSGSVLLGLTAMQVVVFIVAIKVFAKKM